MNEVLWARGAESEILRVDRWGLPLVIKRRPGKTYLLNSLDESLRRTRTIRECRMLTYARRLGVPTPAVHSVDLIRFQFIMDFIEGYQLKQLAGELTEQRLKRSCEEFGRMIGTLHNGGIVHGDPTTSNVIVDNKQRLWLVDFGLAEWNATVEMKGVDLHLIRRALETTHWNLQDQMLDSTIQGYISVVKEQAEEILARMEEIRERGRYH